MTLESQKHAFDCVITKISKWSYSHVLRIKAYLLFRS